MGSEGTFVNSLRLRILQRYAHVRSASEPTCAPAARPNFILRRPAKAGHLVPSGAFVEIYLIYEVWRFNHKIVLSVRVFGQN